MELPSSGAVYLCLAQAAGRGHFFFLLLFSGSQRICPAMVAGVAAVVVERNAELDGPFYFYCRAGIAFEGLLCVCLENENTFNTRWNCLMVLSSPRRVGDGNKSAKK